MLNNLTNFFNIIKEKFIKKTLDPSDLIAIGTKDYRYGGGYKPTAIKYEDLQLQVARPYKCYTVSLVQLGTEPPTVVNEFENSLNVQATYTRVGGGNYYVTFDQSLFNGPDDYVTISQGYYEDGFTPYSYVYARPVFFNAVQIASVDGGLVNDNIIGQVNGIVATPRVETLRTALFRFVLFPEM